MLQQQSDRITLIQLYDNFFQGSSESGANSNQHNHGYFTKQYI